MNEEIYNIVKAFYALGVNLGESKKAIPKVAHDLIYDYYKQIGEHEAKWMYTDSESDTSVSDERVQTMEKLDYPNENSCYIPLGITDTFTEVVKFAQTKTKTMKKDLRDKQSKAIILAILHEIAVEFADELNYNLLDSTEELSEENVLNAIEGVVSITELRHIIESIYLKHILIQTKGYIDNKLNFLEELKTNNYTKKMTKILDSQYKAIDKAKDLLQLVKIRGKFELEVIKLYACYNVDEVVNVQKEILTRSQVKKLVNYAKTIKKDINNKNKNSRFAVTKCHNAMIKTNYK